MILYFTTNNYYSYMQQKVTRSLLLQVAPERTVVLHLQPLLDALLVEQVPALQFYDLDLVVLMLPLEQIVQANRALSEVVLCLLANHGLFCQFELVAVQQGFIYAAVEPRVPSVVVETGTVLIVLLAEDDADDGDEEGSGRIEHPGDHGVFRAKLTLFQQLRKQADGEEGEVALLLFLSKPIGGHCSALGAEQQTIADQRGVKKYQNKYDVKIVPGQPCIEDGVTLLDPDLDILLGHLGALLDDAERGIHFYEKEDACHFREGVEVADGQGLEVEDDESHREEDALEDGQRTDSEDGCQHVMTGKQECNINPF